MQEGTGSGMYFTAGLYQSHRACKSQGWVSPKGRSDMDGDLQQGLDVQAQKGDGGRESNLDTPIINTVLEA